MSDLSQQPSPETPAKDTSRPKSATILLLAILVRIPLIVGGILTAVSAFLPWFHLSTPSPIDGPPEIDVNPWTVIHLDVGAPLFGLALALLLAALGILVSSVLLAFSRNRRIKSTLMSILLALAFLSLCGVVLAQNIATTGLALATHYHATQEYGLLVFIAGCLSAAFGAPLVFTLPWPQGRAESAEAA
jgi:MFS family permease